MGLCWELASLVVGRLTGAATVVDEVHGFKYLDERDLLGFFDGTENPTGPAAKAAVLMHLAGESRVQARSWTSRVPGAAGEMFP